MALIISSSWTLPALVVTVSESLFLIMKIQGVRIHGPVIPMELGLIKDFADVAIVILFPWHGWVFAICLLVMLFLRSENKHFITFLFLSSVATAIISSIYEFNEPTLLKVARGTFTYLAINLFVFMTIFLIKSAIKGGR